MQPPVYLFDTSCFYAVARNSLRQNALTAMRPRIKTSPLAVFEIANLRKGPKDFAKRRAAMLALINSRAEVLRDSPDDAVAAAFGMPKPSGGKFDVKHAIRTLALAQRYEDAISGVYDHAYRVKRSLPVDALEEWKREEALRFATEILAGNSDYRSLLGTSPLESPEAEDRMWKSDFPRHATLVGLAVRAGLLRQYASESADVTEAAAKFAEGFDVLYKGTLEPFVCAYVAYRRRLTPGQEPERNALFDLEFFLHMDSYDPHLSLVTQETIWQEIGQQVLPGRVLSPDEVL